MNSIAISVSRLRLISRSGWEGRSPQFFSLAKPRVTALALFTAFVGLMVAPIRLEPLPGVIANSGGDPDGHILLGGKHLGDLGSRRPGRTRCSCHLAHGEIMNLQMQR